MALIFDGHKQLYGAELNELNEFTHRRSASKEFLINKSKKEFLLGNSKKDQRPRIFEILDLNCLVAAKSHIVLAPKALALVQGVRIVKFNSVR